jgi:hypothetical protein
LASAVVLAWGASSAGAADWELSPKFELGYLYDSNYRLTPPGTENEVSGGVLDAEFALTSTNPLTQFSFIPRVRSSYFPDDPNEESTDYFATLDWDHHTERLRTGVRADYSQQSVASSEQPTADIDSDLGETGGADAGVVFIRNTRELARLRPTLSYEFTPRRRLELGADVVDVGFDREVPGAQTGYTDVNVNAGFAFVTSPRTAVTVRALGSSYDVDTEGNSADAYGLEFEWSMSTSETMRAFVRGGAQRTIFEDDPLTGVAGEEATTWLAGAGVSRSVRLTELFLDGTHSVGPTASGLVMQRDQVRFRLKHLFSPRLSLFTGLRATRDDAIESASLFRTRNYATTDLGFEWRMWQQLSMTLAVDYTWQEFDGDGLSGSTSGGGRLSFLYEPRRRD